DPVQRLSHTWSLKQVGAAQFAYKGAHLPGQSLRYARHARQDNRVFFLQGRKIDPIIQTAPAQCIVNLTCAVRRNDYNRRLSGYNRANLRNSNLEIRQQFEEVRLKFFIAAI